MSAEDNMTKTEAGIHSSSSPVSENNSGFCGSTSVVFLIQKVMAEAIGTYILMYIGCSSVVVEKIYGTVTNPGISLVWGLTVMVMIYSVGHISGAHFNPAVTITFAIFRRFPYKQVPLYIAAQLMGAILASVSVYLIFEVKEKEFFGTTPSGPIGQSLILEFITSFILMFVISGVSTDTRAIGELAGLAVGMTLLVNILAAGPVSGASMNPVRTIGPAIVMKTYKGLWIYIVGPISGTIAGAFVYNMIRLTDKPLREITKSGSFLGTVPKASARS